MKYRFGAGGNFITCWRSSLRRIIIHDRLDWLGPNRCVTMICPGHPDTVAYKS